MINNLLQYLEYDAKEYPNKKALGDEFESVTYREYEEYSKRIGAYIAEKLNGLTNRPVAVIIERNIRSILTFMGVVYSGNFYVPVDATMPIERINIIFNTLNPVMVIDARNKEEVFDDAVSVNDILKAETTNFEVLKKIRMNAIDTDPLYAIFTSGSTGVPKGVVVCHRSVIDLVNSFEEAFSFDKDCIFGNQAPFDFDVSVKDIYNSLMVGASLEIVPRKLFKMPKVLVEYICDKGINSLIWAVSALRIISDFKALNDTLLPKLRYVMFSGEVMPVRSLNYWMDKIPRAMYVNLYGPTEITCNCTYYKIEKRFDDGEMLPIGKAFKNTRVILRDDKNSIITDTNKIGEICVMGTCIALGYWNNKEKTDAAFVTNPLVTSYESKMYATGDLGYYNVDGDIVFASRKDFQIKHMGHRIELGEIEVALNSIPCLVIACCVYDKEKEKIVCFYQAEKECKKDIVVELSKKLPKYMWPNVYIHCNEMPMSKNGKIDRVKLTESLKNGGK